MTPQDKEAINYAENNWMALKDEDEESLLRIGFHAGWQAAIEASKNQWVPVSERLPENGGHDILGYNEKWIDPDSDLLGVRNCTYCEGNWTSAKWSAYSDCYMSENTELDNSEPPTHWMALPTPPNPDKP